MPEGRFCLLNKLNKQENFYLIIDIGFILAHKPDGACSSGSCGGGSMCVEEIDIIHET